MCWRHTLQGLVSIPREQAVVVDAPAFFGLYRKDKRNFVCDYGYSWLRLFPRRFLDSEIASALSLLPVLFESLERGIPRQWHNARLAERVSDHAMLLGSQRLG
jgi:hypothetical protein